MTRPSNLQMHREHRTWKSEDAMWRDDVRAWEEETHAAQHEIARVQAALAEHLHELEKHAAAVRLYETDRDAHEHSLASRERIGGPEKDSDAGGRHSAEADKHENLRAAHERLKRRHHTRLAHWNLLVKSLEASL